MKEQKKILLVEDSQDLMTLLSMRLQVNGYLVITAMDGQEALDKVRDENPDLIIMDLMIPKIDGYEVCRMLKFNDKYKGIPIIILSAIGHQKEIEKAIKAGADAYVLKPFDAEALLTKIRDSLLTKAT